MRKYQSSRDAAVVPAHQPVGHKRDTWKTERSRQVRADAPSALV